jgi:hypothetical protein
MLMELDQHERYEFIERVMRDNPPAFKVTQPGDPEKQQRLRRTLPHVYVNLVRFEYSREG